MTAQPQGSRRRLVEIPLGTVPANQPFPRSRWDSGVPDVRRIRRDEFYTGLLFMGFANGLVEKILHEVAADGLAASAFHTFGISVFEWAAIGAGLALLWGADPRPLRRFDFAVGALAAISFLVPVPALALVAVSAICLYLVVAAQTPQPLGRGARILLAATLPLLWVRLLLATVGNIFMSADATMVGLVVGTPVNGNAIQFADGSGFMVLGPDCSSLTNVSIAILCMVLFVEVKGCRWSWRIARFAVMGCAAAVAVNIARVSLIGLYPQYFSLLHGPVGATIADWTTILAILTICSRGTTHHEQAPA